MGTWNTSNINVSHRHMLFSYIKKFNNFLQVLKILNNALQMITQKSNIYSVELIAFINKELIKTMISI